MIILDLNDTVLVQPFLLVTANAQMLLTEIAMNNLVHKSSSGNCWYPQQKEIAKKG